MVKRLIKFIPLLILLSQMFLTAQKKEIVAYYLGGNAYRSYFVKNLVTNGAADKITVMDYSFARPDKDSTGKIILLFDHYLDYQMPFTAENSVDGIADDPIQLLRGQFNQLKKLKAKYPKIKILLSIGGWGGCNYFSDAALTSQSREIFVNDCINKFIYGNLPLEKNAGGKMAGAAGIFDGFDIDWEFPVSGGPDGTHYNKNDKENFTKLLEVFRKKLDAINPKLLLTAAIAANKPNLYNYDLKSAAQYLNWYNLMTYDYHGVWNNAAAHHTNLLSSPADTTWNGSEDSFDRSVKYLLDSIGISSRKIIPGAAFYGKSWINVDSTNGGLYQPGTFATHGWGNYSRLCTLESNGFKYYWDTIAMAPWLYNKETKTFWTFEDPKSIALKSRYVDAYKLGGLMFWEISGDDSLGTLLNTIYNRNMPDIKINRNKLGTTLPSIKMIKPLGTDPITAGSNLIISTIETGIIGTVKKVEFFGDDVSLGYDTKAPFDWVWFNVPEGNHKVKVIATDDKGDTAISKEMEIHITDR